MVLIIIIVNNNNLRNLIEKYIKKFTLKYVPTKYVKLHKFIDNLFITNNRINKILIVIYLVLLIVIKLMNIYFISELNTNIDDYILVYNHIKKSSLSIFVLPLLNNNYFTTLRCPYGSHHSLPFIHSLRLLGEGKAIDNKLK